MANPDRRLGLCLNDNLSREQQVNNHAVFIEVFSETESGRAILLNLARGAETFVRKQGEAGEISRKVRDAALLIADTDRGPTRITAMAFLQEMRNTRKAIDKSNE